MFKWFFQVCFLILFYDILAQTLSNVTKAQKKEDKISNYDWDVWCKFQPNGYDCSKKGYGPSRFYYDTLMDDCKTFDYGSCQNAMNNFKTITECHDMCRDSGPRPLKLNVSARIYCRYQPDFGQCQGYYPMFYYDLTLRTCRGFSYSGCGGNYNRFFNPQTCASVCGAVVDY